MNKVKDLFEMVARLQVNSGASEALKQDVLEQIQRLNVDVHIESQRQGMLIDVGRQISSLRRITTTDKLFDEKDLDDGSRERSQDFKRGLEMAAEAVQMEVCQIEEDIED